MKIIRKIKTIIKNSVENIRRIGIKDNIFSFKYHGKKIFFYLPYKKDYAQQQILFKNTFYEENLLKKINKLIPNNSIILDIGSNIGNHIIYYAKILNAAKIYGFEPQKDVFNILKKNMELNNLTQKVDLFNFGLGSKDENVAIENRSNNNCGATSLIAKEGGNLKISKLDKTKIKEKIDFVKIDTEGFEKEVLVGGLKTISSNKPQVWVEIDKKNKKFVFDYFKKLNYLKHIKLDNYGNHLFVPK